VKNKKTVQKTLGAAFFGTLLLLACTKDKATPKSALDCNAAPHTFAADVHPIFTTNCALSDCHSSSMDESGFTMNTYEEIVAATEIDEFFKAIKHEPGATPMPDGAPKLPQEEIDAIECWVLAGTPDN